MKTSNTAQSINQAIEHGWRVRDNHKRVRQLKTDKYSVQIQDNEGKKLVIEYL